jgi:glyoxylase-like metal-dependent hydrolase (beta-lactamase superfamily II)
MSKKIPSSVSVKPLSDLLQPGEPSPTSPWQLKAILSDDCMSYVVWNTQNREALLVDPKLDEIDFYRVLIRELSSYLWLAVIDTHTHADHVSAAAQLAQEISAPLIMHQKSPCSRVHLRICSPTVIPGHSAPMRFLLTPGHTEDGLTFVWGPFAFTGDTVFYGDVGRDDLPGGSPEAHFESLQILKRELLSETLICPGHDFKGGRISSWATQLKVNSSLTQPKAEFIQEAAAFDAPAPALFKKALFENFK